MQAGKQAGVQGIWRPAGCTFSHSIIAGGFLLDLLGLAIDSSRHNFGCYIICIVTIKLHKAREEIITVAWSTLPEYCI